VAQDDADGAFLFEDGPADIAEAGDLLSAGLFFEVAVGQAFAA
jgi:hypothetical protein